MDKQFIKTSDADTAEKLQKEGFSLLNKDNNMWTFINDGKLLFDDKDKKIVFTNKLEL